MKNSRIVSRGCMGCLAAIISLPAFTVLAAEPPWIVFQGKEGPGVGKHIVLVSGDEEYRSEEGLPQLAKILARHHGFKCTVLFAVDPDGTINPNNTHNIPGLEALDRADLMVIQTRFRDLPDGQMKHFDDFLKAGKPVIGLRTATHAFQIHSPKNGPERTYAHYSWDYQGDQKQWSQGFGRLVLGETWISHHGQHMRQSTRGVFAPGAADSPLLTGIKDGEIWGPTDVYGVRLPLLPQCIPILLGQCLSAPAKKDDSDPNYGMKPTDEPLPSDDKKNDPMMPLAWTKSYQLPDGKPGKSFTTTMGSSTDLANQAMRRLLVNAVYWLLDMKAPEKANVEIVGQYHPNAYRGNGFVKGMVPSKLSSGAEDLLLSQP